MFSTPLPLSDRTQFYWPYMFTKPRAQLAKSGFHLSLYVQYTLNTYCSLTLSDRNQFYWPYIYAQYTKNPAVKKWLMFEPICACSIHSKPKQLPFSNMWQIWIWKKKKSIIPSFALPGWAGCIISCQQTNKPPLYPGESIHEGRVSQLIKYCQLPHLCTSQLSF